MRKVIAILFLIGATSFAVIGQEATSKRKALIEVPDIHGRATLLNKPILSGDILLQHDGMTVTLRTVVDESGNVMSAKCSLTCPAEVAQAAEAAAVSSKFRPLIINGVAVKYSGSLMYTLAVERVNWYRFGTALYSTYIFDNISLGPVAEMLTYEFSTEKASLRELDNGVELEVRWKTINHVRDSIKGKIKGVDVWHFELGMAVRQVSAPFQSDHKLVREELQQALADLKKFVDSAPPTARVETVQAIRAASEYVIAPEITNRQLYTEVQKLVFAIDPDTQRIRPPVPSNAPKP